MKTKLFILLILTFLSIGGISKNSINIRKEVKLHSKDKVETRSAAPCPISANIDGALLTVSFLESTTSRPTAIAIIITNAENGEIVYSEVYTSSSSITIDLDEYDTGEYRLEFAIGNSYFVGLFAI